MPNNLDFLKRQKKKPGDVLQRGNQKRREKLWRDAEKSINKNVRGRIQPASGALNFAKGDIKGSKVLVEVKQTSKEGFRVTKKLLKKIENEAMEATPEGLTPVLALQFSPSSAPFYRTPWETTGFFYR